VISNGENLSLLFAAIVVVLVLGLSVWVFLNKKLTDTNKDRFFAFMGIAIAAIALIVSAWQNRLAADDARESAVASKQSADAAAASLTIEKAAAITLHCSLYASGKPEAYFGVTFDTQGAMESTYLPTAVSPHISYQTCVINNYGRQPILDVVLPVVLQFTAATGASYTSSIPETLNHQVQLKIDGVPAGGSYTFWVGNEGQINFLLALPQSISFIEPDGTPGTFRFSQMPSGSLLAARTPFAPGEKHGFIKITSGVIQAPSKAALTSENLSFSILREKGPTRLKNVTLSLNPSDENESAKTTVERYLAAARRYFAVWQPEGAAVLARHQAEGEDVLRRLGLTTFDAF
jgi:hypothetical protein